MVKKELLPFPYLIVFDLDGCLVDTLPAIVIAVNKLRSIFDKDPINKDTIRSYMGVSLNTFLGRVITGNQNPQMNDNRVIQSQRLYNDLYLNSIRKHVKVFNGIQKVLDYIFTLNIKPAVCTNKSSTLAWNTLKVTNLDQFFNSGDVIGSDSMFKPKPNPQSLQFLIKKYKTSSDKVWMIGDSKIDIEFAKAANCISIWASYGYGSLFEIKPDFVVDKPSKIIKIINKIEDFKI